MEAGERPEGRGRTLNKPHTKKKEDWVQRRGGSQGSGRWEKKEHGPEKRGGRGTGMPE